MTLCVYVYIYTYRYVSVYVCVCVCVYSYNYNTYRIAIANIWYKLVPILLNFDLIHEGKTQLQEDLGYILDDTEDHLISFLCCA